MAVKAVRALYQSRNFTTGLQNAKAQIYLDGASKLVGNNAVLLNELDATNAPGVYELTVSASALAAMNAQPGQTLEVVINSATAMAEAIFKKELVSSSTDDLETHLGAVDIAIAAVKTDTAAVRNALESGTSSLATILAGINQIKANAGFAVSIPASLQRPGGGQNQYRIPLRIYNDANMLLDPDANSIKVSVTNQSGADRSAYLQNASAGEAAMVRDSLGSYRIDLAIPSTAAEEELIFTFKYAIGGSQTSRTSVSEIISDVQAEGFALQNTLLANNENTLAIMTALNNAGYGLQASQAARVAIQNQTDKLGDSVIGLQAIRAGIAQNSSDIQTQVMGAGFNATTDSLHAISQLLVNLAYSGGKAI